MTHIELEIGGLSRWPYGDLRGIGLPVTCNDPRHLGGLTRTMPVRTDRNEARSIAQVMRVGWYLVVHIKIEPGQELRMLLTNRWTLLIKKIDALGRWHRVPLDRGGSRDGLTSFAIHPDTLPAERRPTGTRSG